ncbi:30S ribosomal protein S9 [Allokutzneria sp. A3M-2-11 16]|uniref:30S ribosomal protein S9 n=1 Tax=Allokutzneria sp. A3M-2-11 16 TaxID=2962043 RepID=UPI0020B80969|nr:30S ribosomal protein S9 [Allokutzneria sp. A3M-2-11 16]MCP3798846.1 30S ribosomal protein S9 [Allokutzneria sp. A3M-2-11 16]
MTTPADETTPAVDETVADEAVATEAVATEAAADEAAADEATTEVAADEAATEGVAEATSDEVAPAAEVAAPLGTGRLIQTVGRRKQAIVRVRLVPGTGKFLLNGKDIDAYFPNKVHQQLIRDPFTTTDKLDKFDVFGTLSGGGVSGQAGALRLAIARALITLDADDRPALKKAGFLTRDPRAKERKKYGLKKARKAPQYSKR